VVTHKGYWTRVKFDNSKGRESRASEWPEVVSSHKGEGHETALGGGWYVGKCWRVPCRRIPMTVRKKKIWGSGTLLTFVLPVDKGQSEDGQWFRKGRKE